MSSQEARQGRYGEADCISPMAAWTLGWSQLVASSNWQHCKGQANQGKRVLLSSAMELQSLWMQVGWSLGQLSQNTPTLLLLT